MKPGLTVDPALPCKTFNTRVAAAWAPRAEEEAHPRTRTGPPGCSLPPAGPPVARETCRPRSVGRAVPLCMLTQRQTVKSAFSSLRPVVVKAPQF